MAFEIPIRPLHPDGAPALLEIALDVSAMRYVASFTITMSFGNRFRSRRATEPAVNSPGIVPQISFP